MTAGNETADDAAPRGFLSSEVGTRIQSGLVLAATVLFALVAGGWLFAAAWLAAAIVGACEWIAMSRTEPGQPLMLLNVSLLAAVTLAIQGGAAFWTVVGLVVIGALAVAWLARGADGRLNALGGFLGALVIGLVPPALRDDPGIGIVGPAWMFAIVWVTDIAAYFTGRSLGGPKLMPRVSPKKTWSGALGGLVGGMLAGLTVALVTRHYGWSDLASLPLPIIVAASAVASVVSQAGDLVESSLKRRYGVKDSGQSIPGHGGIMDRLDGFFAVAALAGLYLLVRKAFLS